jgi:hypothetical protein
VTTRPLLGGPGPGPFSARLLGSARVEANRSTSASSLLFSLCSAATVTVCCCSL